MIIFSVAVICILIVIFGGVVLFSLIEKRTKKLAQIKSDNHAKLIETQELLRETEFILYEVRDLDYDSQNVFEDVILCVAHEEIKVLGGVIGKFFAMNESDPGAVSAFLKIQSLEQIIKTKKDMLMKIRMSSAFFRQYYIEGSGEVEYVVLMKSSDDN
ncbi:MAG TPA: hypothetical protein PLF30_01265 [Candidatus Moranbacteria bacterium]|jgi:hypothetical protein|nr:hypothetical protein [Candidatus Moranbacteria bacterium]HPX94165.1 hypothetical protein [Candidatus Moranbacteria bacterium]HQB59225.1 hypothetical protein [Candidatus Moranbacteria bacterium]